MKTFPWLLTLAFGVVCFTGWVLSSVILKSLSDIRGALPLPAITVLVLQPNAWVLFCPAPWIIYSTVLSFRREVTSSSLFVFTGTLLVAATVLVCALVIACVVPWLPFKISLAQ
jgi:hypothetical protein